MTPMLLHMKNCIAVAAALLFVPHLASANTLTNGLATINFDKAAWDSLAAGIGAPQPVLTLSAFFNQAQASPLSVSQAMTTPQTSPSYLNQVYAMNGTSVANEAGRATQPTTFDYTPGNAAAHTGFIGLGGLARFDVSSGGTLLYGDYSVHFDTSRTLVGGSGWYLKGNIAPAGAAFDLLNVNVVDTAGALSISGNLGVSPEVATFLYGTPSDSLRNVGTFSFSATSVPEPTTVTLLGLSGLMALWRGGKRVRR